MSCCKQLANIPDLSKIVQQAVGKFATPFSFESCPVLCQCLAYIMHVLLQRGKENKRLTCLRKRPSCPWKVRVSFQASDHSRVFGIAYCLLPCLRAIRKELLDHQDSTHLQMHLVIHLSAKVQLLVSQRQFCCPATYFEPLREAVCY